MFGFRRSVVYLLLFAMIFINFIDRITLSIAGKTIAGELGLSPVQLGYLFSSYLWSYILFLIPGGILVDRWGARKTAAAVITLWSLAQMATGLSIGLATMIASRLGLGIGECPTNSVASRALREWAPASERGAAMAAFISGSFIGPAIGSLLVGALLALVGWRMSFIITGVAGLVWMVIWLAVYRAPEQARWLGAAERDHILRSREVEGAPVQAGSSTILQMLGCLSMWGVGLTQGGLGYNLYLFLAWLPNYLQTTKGLSLADTSTYTAIAFGIAGVLVIFLSRISDRFLTPEGVRQGKRRVAVCICLVLAASVALVPAIDSLAVIIVLIGFSLTFTATGISMNFTLTNDLVTSPNDVGKGFAILNIGANGFGMLAPIVTGYVVQASGRFDLTFYLSGGMLLVGSMLTLVMTHHPIGARSPGRVAPLRGSEQAP